MFLGNGQKFWLVSKKQQKKGKQMKTYEKIEKASKGLTISLLLVLEALVEYSDNIQSFIEDFGLNDCTEQEISRNKMHTAISNRFRAFSVSYLRLYHTLADRLIYCQLWDKRVDINNRRYKLVMTYCDTAKYEQQHITETLTMCMNDTLEGTFIAHLNKLKAKDKATKQKEREHKQEQDLQAEKDLAEIAKQIEGKQVKNALSLDYVKVQDVIKALESLNEKELEQLGFERLELVSKALELGQALKSKLENDKELAREKELERVQRIKEQNNVQALHMAQVEKAREQYRYYLPYVNNMNEAIVKAQGRKLNLRHQPITQAFTIDWNKGLVKVNKRLANKLVKELETANT